MKNILLIIAIFYSVKSFAQIPGVNDNNWRVIPDLTDYFDRSTNWQGVASSGAAKWYFGYPWGATHDNDASWHNQSELDVRLEWDVNNPQDGKIILPIKQGSAEAGYQYSGTSFNSGEVARYGFFRAKLKLPFGRGLFPAFWLWNAYGQDCLSYCGNSSNYGSFCNGWYNEIDIMENPYSDQVGQVGSNFHVLDYDYCPVLSGLKNAEMINTYTEPHTYAVEWTPAGLEYYYDNVHFHGMKESGRVPSHDLKMILSAQIAPFYLPNQNTVFTDNYFEVYEIESYELICEYREQDYEIVDQSALNLFQWGVRKSISFGSSGSTNTIVINNNTTFRAEEGIVINTNTLINTNNTEVLFTITKCEN